MKYTTSYCIKRKTSDQAPPTEKSRLYNEKIKTTLTYIINQNAGYQSQSY
jgi:hypothetical protein